MAIICLIIYICWLAFRDIYDKVKNNTTKEKSDNKNDDILEEDAELEEIAMFDILDDE